MDKLTPKQQKWLMAYKKHGNATRAAREAGYECKNDLSFRKIGSENLARLGSHIREFEEQIKSENIADISECNEFLTSVMRDGEQKLADRIKAAEIRMRSAGAFATKHESDSSGGGAVILAGGDMIAD